MQVCLHLVRNRRLLPATASEYFGEARIFMLEHAQLLTQGKDLEAEVVTGTEEGAETGKKPKEKVNHGPDL